MLIAAHVMNEREQHTVTLTTDGAIRSLSVAPRSGGNGSSANGGELLCLAVATCYCNDIYREAAQRNVPVLRVEVSAHAEFGLPGEAAKSINYRAKVTARASEPAIRELMLHTDRVAEVQNTLRQGMDVRLEAVVAESSSQP